MSEKDNLLIYSFEPLSFANGPGRRSVLWVQGCTLNCSGCFNPETHNLHNGKSVSVDEVLSWVVKEENKIDGLTISGGEPLQQPNQIGELCEKVKLLTNLSIILFTGFKYQELLLMPVFKKINNNVDVLVSGRYEKDNRQGSKFLGSSNQKIHLFSDRYTEEDLVNVPVSEVVIDSSGNIVITGVDPMVKG